MSVVLKHYVSAANKIIRIVFTLHFIKAYGNDLSGTLSLANPYVNSIQRPALRGGPRNSDSYLRCKIAGLKEGGSQHEQDEEAEIFTGA